MDDSAAVRGAIRQFFEARTSYRVCDEADDGLSAIQKAEGSHCDLVLLDLSMPNLSGVEAASILRRTLPEAKIVGFSALRGDADLGDELIRQQKIRRGAFQVGWPGEVSGGRKGASLQLAAH